MLGPLALVLRLGALFAFLSIVAGTRVKLDSSAAADFLRSCKAAGNGVQKGDLTSTAAGLMRLRGGWCRGDVKHRKIRMIIPPARKQNWPAKTSTRFGVGPKLVTRLDMYHGKRVIEKAIWTGTPRIFDHDPRTRAFRLGLRIDQMQTNMPFKLTQKGDVNQVLLKVCNRGFTELIDMFIDAGADINFVGKAKTGLDARYIGLTPLSAAAHSGHVETVRYLLGLGADPNAGEEEVDTMGGKLWIQLARDMNSKKIEAQKSENIKAVDWKLTANGRRTPGIRKTRHAKGHRGKN